jgi:hypothetical protein
MTTHNTVTRVRNGKVETFLSVKAIHGESKTPLYRRWKKMKERCYSPNAQNYRWYGGRGIYVCEEWLNDYIAFKSWALDNNYAPEMELDRIDNDGPYSPSNCRWVTKLTNKETRANYLTPELEAKLIARAKKDSSSIHTVIKRALESYL